MISNSSAIDVVKAVDLSGNDVGGRGGAGHVEGAGEGVVVIHGGAMKAVGVAQVGSRIETIICGCGCGCCGGVVVVGVIVEYGGIVRVVLEEWEPFDHEFVVVDVVERIMIVGPKRIMGAFLMMMVMII